VELKGTPGMVLEVVSTDGDVQGRRQWPIVTPQWTPGR
jgi:hypothetical protein